MTYPDAHTPPLSNDIMSRALRVPLADAEIEFVMEWHERDKVDNGDYEPIERTFPLEH